MTNSFEFSIPSSFLLVVLVEDGLSLRSVGERELLLNALLLVDKVAHGLFDKIALDLALLHSDASPLIILLHLLDETTELSLAIVSALRGEHKVELAYFLVVCLGLHKRGLELLGKTWRALTQQQHLVEVLNRLLL